MKWICVALLSGTLAACSGVGQAPDANEPIPPPRSGPFEGFGSSAPPPDVGGRPSVN